MDYFKLAADQARSHAAKTLEKKEPCRCLARTYPHRRDGCCAETGFTFDKTTADAQELALFDMAEAQALNRGKS